MKCRNCNYQIKDNFLDLGHAPPSNAYLSEHDLLKVEKYFPLKVGVCRNCWLVQTEDYIAADNLFTKDYAYLSSTSQSWLKHCKKFVNYSIDEFNLTSKSLVIEVASNDGYLLQYYKNKGIPCLGIEPTEYTAKIAAKKNLNIINEFLTLKNAKIISTKEGKADLIIGNNVYAHVPDIKDFTLAIKELLNENGIISLEFPHLMQLIKGKQFDTIYHEHFSYLSFTTVFDIFKNSGLRIFDVEELETHGGSIRVLGCLQNSHHIEKSSVQKLLDREKKFGIKNIKTYESFQDDAELIKNSLIELLLDIKKENKVVMGYGAAAKGNTLLNYAGIKSDLIKFVFDNAKSKQNKYLPGSHIKVLDPREIAEKKPDYLLILPWNISKEIMDSLHRFREKGIRFITVIPEVRIF